MEFEFGKALIGGLIGTVAMTMVMYMGSMMGMKMDMPMTLGTMLLPRGGAAWGLGLMAHLMMGMVFFIIYAVLFKAFGIQSGVIGWSALFGAVHSLVAGIAFGMMPALHPRMVSGPDAGTDRVPAPGFMGAKMGPMGPMGVVVVHVAYGLVAGAIYSA